MKIDWLQGLNLAPKSLILLIIYANMTTLTDSGKNRISKEYTAMGLAINIYSYPIN